jgi:TetR/AcrR family transcriptional regulator, transcriptional repressor for nem operon
MGRTSTARQRLLESASQLIHSRGYGSLGIAEICDQAGVRKGSFYHFFESKQALTVAVLLNYWENQRIEWTSILGGEGSPIERLEKLFRAQARTQALTRRTTGFINGCMLANLTLELSTQDHVVQGHLNNIFREQIGLIEAVLREAAEQGALAPDRATAVTARSMLAQLEGMVLFAKLANDPAILDGLWPQIAELIDQPVAARRASFPATRAAGSPTPSRSRGSATVPPT